MNTILNIVLPIILLVVLNILVSTVSAVSAEKTLCRYEYYIQDNAGLKSKTYFYTGSVDLEYENSLLF